MRSSCRLVSGGITSVSVSHSEAAAGCSDAGCCGRGLEVGLVLSGCDMPTHRLVRGMPRVRSARARTLSLNILRGRVARMRARSASAAHAAPSERGPALRSTRGSGWLAVALAVSLASCVTDAAHRGQAGREQGAAARPPLDLTGEAPWPAPYDSDPLWRRAASG